MSKFKKYGENALATEICRYKYFENEQKTRLQNSGAGYALTADFKAYKHSMKLSKLQQACIKFIFNIKTL